MGERPDIETRGIRCEVWARSRDEHKPTSRMRGTAPLCMAEARRLASASGDEGVMGVAVLSPDGTAILWEAGEELFRDAQDQNPRSDV